MNTKRCLVAIAYSAVLASYGCSDGTGPPNRPLGTLRIVAGAGLSDTIQVRHAQPLTVEVRDSTGKPRSGVIVRFDAVPERDSFGRAGTVITVAEITSQNFSLSVTDSTDALGQAHALVAFGIVAGSAGVAVSVPTLGLIDTAGYTVNAGVAARIVFGIRDTAVAVGKRFSPNAASADRFGNRRTDPVTYAAASSTCSVDVSGQVSGLSVGRCAVAVRSSAAVDTARATVVPDASIVVFWLAPDGSNASVGIVALDGSNRRNLAIPVSHDVYPTTSRGGSRTVFRDQDRLFIVDGSGARRSLLSGAGTLGWEGWPRLSRDSSWVYFSGGSKSSGSAAIYRIHPDGSGFERIALSGFVSNSTQPDPSPDGTRVAFVGDGRIQIHTLGSSATPIAFAGGALPRWSPTGDRIAFLSDFSVKVMNADGSNSRQISPIGESYTDTAGLDWSADGRWIIVRGAALLELIDVTTRQSLPLIFAGTAFQPTFLR